MIKPTQSTPHPHVLSHTRCDYPQPTSPKIPVPANRPLTNCSHATERRIRRLLCWHAGDCGLVDLRVVQLIADLHLDGEVSMRDLFKLAKPLVYSAIYWRVHDIREAQSKRSLADRALGEHGR